MNEQYNPTLGCEEDDQIPFEASSEDQLRSSGEGGPGDEGNVSSGLEEEVRGLSDDVAGRARYMAEEGKTSVVRRVGYVAKALREAGRSLEHNDEMLLARVTGEAAEALEGFAGDMRGQDAASLIRAADGYARNHPGAFVGGSLLAGFVLGRFIHAATGNFESKGGEPIGEVEAEPDESLLEAIGAEAEDTESPGLEGEPGGRIPASRLPPEHGFSEPTGRPGPTPEHPRGSGGSPIQQGSGGES